MNIEIIGNISEEIVNVNINSTDYNYSSLSNNDKFVVDSFINLVLSKIDSDCKYLSINNNNANVVLTFNGVSNGDYHELLDFNNLSDSEKFKIDEFINL